MKKNWSVIVSYKFYYKHRQMAGLYLENGGTFLGDDVIKRQQRGTSYFLDTKLITITLLQFNKNKMMEQSFKSVLFILIK